MKSLLLSVGTHLSSPACSYAFPIRKLLGAEGDSWHEMEVLGVESRPDPASRCGFVAGKAGKGSVQSVGPCTPLLAEPAPVLLPSSLVAPPLVPAALAHREVTLPWPQETPEVQLPPVDKQLLQMLLPRLPARFQASLLQAMPCLRSGLYGSQTVSCQESSLAWCPAGHHIR